MNFKKINNIFGWVTLLIASFVFLKTIEPTASWWDCGEFISSAYKLEPGHPPGAPLFLMMGKVFSIFAFGDTSKVAITVNVLSAMASAFTIMFLFWSITLLARKFYPKNHQYNLSETILIIGSGLVGALGYTFTDSFWFSAVEGEVYATSAFFTAIVFWAILKWESVADEKGHMKWILLIGYLMGLSIGVHLLNLLTIPALAFVIYFKRYQVTKKGLFLATCAGVGVLIFVQYGIIPSTVAIAAWFEKLFVNSFGLPFNSGVIFYGVGIIALLVYGIRYTIKKQKVLYNNILLFITVILLGYSSFALIVIRSAADTPLNENNPSNVFSLLSYLNREQYGDRPLLYGPQFNSVLVSNEEGEPRWFKGKTKYEIGGYKPELTYKPEVLLPRMYSNQPNHIEAYKDWCNFKGRKETVQMPDGQTQDVLMPTLGENLAFLFKYQIGHMYFRYFMWNFVGRQNDIEGHGNKKHGDWISGINFLDNWRLGKQDDMPRSLNNIAHNKFYFLPLIIGLFGLIYQYNRNKKDFSIVAILFFLTGLAIILYLNQYPLQPRERDYAYAGSFYAFAIWIGLGVFSIADFLKKKLNANTAAVIATVAGLFMAPVILAKDGWNDHDRSHKYATRDYAANYLNSCAPNAILFTNGDNDTFPLWYCQEVEGIRTDVRVVNLALLGGEWYIEQMRRKEYESDPLPISLPEDSYKPGKNDVIRIFNDPTADYLPQEVIQTIQQCKTIEQQQGFINLTDILSIIKKDVSVLKTTNKKGEQRDVVFIPSGKLGLPIDANQIVALGIVPAANKDIIAPSISWDIKKGYLGKYELIVLDILATNNWKRPIYFVAPNSVSDYMNVEDYCQQEGMAYRLMPYKTKMKDGGVGSVSTDVMFNNVMKKFKWGNLNDPRTNIDTETMRMTKMYRNTLGRLANTLVMQGKNSQAIQVLDLCEKEIPGSKVPYDMYELPIIETYYKAGAFDKGNVIINQLVDLSVENMLYYFKIPAKFADSYTEDVRENMGILERLIYLAQTSKQDKIAKSIEQRFNTIKMSFGTSPYASLLRSNSAQQ